jgi:hypothetical protein
MGKKESTRREYFGVCKAGLCEETDCAEASNDGKVCLIKEESASPAGTDVFKPGTCKKSTCK